MQKRAATAAPSLYLSSSLSNTAQSICEAFALYIRQIPLLFWPFFTFFHIAGAGSIASRRVASPCLFALRWAFAVSMNMNYGNCRAATTAQQQQSVAHNKDNRNGRNYSNIFFQNFECFFCFEVIGSLTKFG